MAAVREAVGQPAEVVYRRDRKSAWAPLSRLNDGIAAAIPGYPEVRAVEWPGAEGLAIRGLLLLPPDRPQAPMPLILDIHGGPTWSFKHGFNPGSALPFAAAGYAVLLPNYRGSVGRGQAFTRLNVGDPGGAEFEDILRGLDWCVQAGIADPARIGVTGVSYGGYLTAWAAATSDRFRAAVMVSGISDLLSYQYTANNGFSAAIVGAPLHDQEARRLYIERSPLMHVSCEGAADSHPARRGRSLHAARPGRGVLSRPRRSRRGDGAGGLSARGSRLPGARPSRRCLAAKGRLVRPLSAGPGVSRGGLVQFFLRRLAMAIPLLLIISFGVFALIQVAPGRPGPRPAGNAAGQTRDDRGDPRALQPRRSVPRPVRQVARAGAAGRSRPLDPRRPAGHAGDRRLGSASRSISRSTAPPSSSGSASRSASLAAFRRGSRLDRVVVMVGVFGVSSPAFVTGIFLLYVFGVVLGWFPTFGAGRGFLDRVWHLTLPALALALSVMAIVVKITRASVIEELDKDYVAFARARGLSVGPHPLRLRAAQRAHPGRHRRRPDRSSASSPARSMSRSPSRCPASDR